jgi:hypothetical protein
MAKNEGINRVILFRPNCKQWQCEYCGQQRARWFMVVAAHGHEALEANGHQVNFATITSRAAIRTVTQGIVTWRKNWPKLLRRMKRAGGYCAYLQIPEQHKDGAYHVHLLATSSINERWLKDNAAECGFGYIADYEPVREAGKAATYVAKYLTKDSHSLQWPKYFRRVNTSRNWPRPEPLQKNDHWAVTMVKKGTSVYAAKLVQELRGYTVEAFTGETGR